MEVDVKSLINKLKKELEENKTDICPICGAKLKISGFKPSESIVLFIDCERCGFKTTYIYRRETDYVLIETQEVTTPWPHTP